MTNLVTCHPTVIVHIVGGGKRTVLIKVVILYGLTMKRKIMMSEFKVVKAYYENPYMGWNTRKPERGGMCDMAYFIKVDGYYFMLGSPTTQNYIVHEEEE